MLRISVLVWLVGWLGVGAGPLARQRLSVISLVAKMKSHCLDISSDFSKAMSLFSFQCAAIIFAGPPSSRTCVVVVVPAKMLEIVSNATITWIQAIVSRTRARVCTVMTRSR